MHHRWGRNGQELFYRNGNQMMAVEVTTQPSFSAGTPRLLFDGQGRYRSGGQRADYDVSPDGQRFVMVQFVESEQSVSQINIVLNWSEELKQRVPVQ